VPLLYWSTVHVEQASSCVEKHPTWICGSQSVHTLTQLSTRLGPACRSIKKPVHDMAQKQRLVEVRFEQTIVNKVIDQ